MVLLSVFRCDNLFVTCYLFYNWDCITHHQFNKAENTINSAFCLCLDITEERPHLSHVI